MSADDEVLKLRLGAEKAVQEVKLNEDTNSFTVELLELAEQRARAGLTASQVCISLITAFAIIVRSSPNTINGKLAILKASTDHIVRVALDETWPP